MYVDPFFFGVLTTLFVEVALIIIAIVIAANKK